VNTQTQADRVTYGAKNGDGGLVSFSTDVRAGESPDQAMARAMDFVSRQCEESVGRGSSNSPRQAARQDGPGGFSPRRFTADDEIYTGSDAQYQEVWPIIRDKVRSPELRKEIHAAFRQARMPISELPGFIAGEMNARFGDRGRRGGSSGGRYRHN
jgi:hypothetical protein